MQLRRVMDGTLSYNEVCVYFRTFKCLKIHLFYYKLVKLDDDILSPSYETSFWAILTVIADCRHQSKGLHHDLLQGKNLLQEL